MTFRSLVLPALAVSAFAGMLTAQAQPAPQGPAKQAEQRAGVFAKLDKNDDGALSRQVIWRTDAGNL